jgi:DNA ligase 1
MRRLEYRDSKSSKFWAIERDGVELVACWGRIGAAGQQSRKPYASEAAAEAALAKQLAGKLAKGYVEVMEAGVVSDPSSEPERAAPPKPASSDHAAGDLPDGGEIEVPGSGSRRYTLRNVGGAYSCTCPAWLHQSLPAERRTCKHLRKFRGDEAEQARLGSTVSPGAVRAPVIRSQTRTGEPSIAPPLLLAHSFEPGEHDPTGWWLSEKLDGVRAYWDGTQFVSRLGNPFLAPAWFTEGLPDFPLDGELFGGRGRFQQTVSIARRMDRGDGWRALDYLIFDAPALTHGFEGRLAALERHFASAAVDRARVLAHRVCAGPEDLAAELARIEALGGEGLMLRRPGSAYVAGRSDTLLKVKSFRDDEARVVGHQAGTGRHQGRLGALLVQLANGTRFKVGTGLSDAQRDDPPELGAIVTVRYQELTDAGVPRFPSFVGVRADVDWEQRVAAASLGETAPRRSRE